MEPFDQEEDIRQKIIGLGESSVRKSYYPQLQDRILELERFHALLDRSRELIVLVEAKNRTIVDLNATVCSIFEASRESLVGSDISQWLPFEVMDKMRALENHREKDARSIIETTMNNSEGNVFIEFVLEYVLFNHEPYFVIFGKDISERKWAESKIHTLAFYDTLTHLPNRQLFHERLMHAIVITQREHSYGALLMIDLDNFKALNDTKGHHLGDELLKQVSDRISSVLKENDTLGRIGGDEFAVLMENVGDDEPSALLATQNCALRIKHLINQPYMLLGYEHTCSSSIGIVLFHGECHNKETLFKQADIAMYQAKHLGRNRICFYDPAMQANIEHKMTMEAELRRAISKEEMTLFYQPQVNLEGKIIGVEALVRWNHPQKGLIPPNAFIPVAEETGLIIPLGNWIMHQACTQMAAWMQQYPKSLKHLSINVSVKQFQESNFCDSVIDVLKQSNLLASYVRLELTESLIVENMRETISKIEALRAVGLSFALDDFGTGYSSLAYLKRLPLDEIKIDQSFVRDIYNDNNDAMIVKTIIEMANNFDLDVIAEGVENKEQFAFLEENGCHLFQGYLFGKPMPAEELERLFLQYKAV
ncbi:MAG: EAL domain-containing protein [Epsilonproteobacteria bacterium]|nr:EAL domain-containing protein [Campylobacterota bacterium]